MPNNLKLQISSFITLIIFLSSICTFGNNHKKDIISSNGLKPFVEPLLSTHWSQDGGENNLLPLLEDGTRALAGCGAVALAQVMNYWKFPECGNGFNYYIWEYPYGTPTVRYADFSDSPYMWDYTAPVYKNNENISDVELEAVGKIMYDLGIALEMKYNDFGTPTSIEVIHTVLKRFYNYNPNSELKRISNGYTQNEWLMMIYKELSEGRPVIMGGDWHGVNHIYVADGYDENGLIHLNMGHADINEPNHDRYYDVFANETYTSNMRMIIGIAPYELPDFTHSIYVSKSGTLCESLGGYEETRKISRLKITGVINNDDLKILNRCCRTTTGQLSYLDLADCEVENNQLPDSTFFHYESNYTLQEIKLPKTLLSIGSKCFMNCIGLYKVSLPDKLESLGSYCFSNCRYLEDLIIPSSVSQIDNNPFRYDKMSKFCVDEENSCFKMDGPFLVSNDGKTLYSAPLNPKGQVEIPIGAQKIESQAFIRMPLIESIILPETVKSIGSWSFSHCYYLSDIYSHAVEPPTLRDNSFENANLDCHIHVPQGSLEAYQNSGWRVFGNIIDDLEVGEVISIDRHKNSIKAIYTPSGQMVSEMIPGGIYLIMYSDNHITKIIYR